MKTVQKNAIKNDLMDRSNLFIPNTDLWFDAYLWWTQKRPKEMDIEDYLANPTAGVRKQEDVWLAEGIARGLRSGELDPDQYQATLIEELNAAKAILDEIAELVNGEETHENLTAEVRAALVRRQ